MLDAEVVLALLVEAAPAELVAEELPARLLSELSVLLAALVALVPAVLDALAALSVPEEAVADSAEVAARVEALLAETAVVLVAVVVEVLAAGICSMMISTSAWSAPALEAEVVLPALAVAVAVEPPALMILMKATMSPAVFTKLPARGMFCIAVLIVAAAVPALVIALELDMALLDAVPLSEEEVPVMLIALAVVVPVVAPAALKPPDQPLPESMLW